MPHTCEAALITCEDYRLHQRKDGRNYISDFIKREGIDCDVITRGGAIQDLVHPVQCEYRNCLLRDSSVSTKLHHCTTIYLINHEGCGAYLGLNFYNKEMELAQHIKDLKEAKDIILKNYPNVEVKTYFAYLKEGTQDVFDIRPV